MERSVFLQSAGAGTVLASAVPAAPMHVAFAIGEGANVIDFAGAWETFQDAGDAFRLFTVAMSRTVVTATGGLRIVPHYTFADSPHADIVVVGAQRGSPELLAWLRSQRGRASTIMSVCTGAFQLARAGLLDGKRATTHHDFYDAFEREFPQCRLVRGPRFVDEGAICSAGGLTSGIHLAVHVVKKYLGPEAARNVAAYMEFVPGARTEVT
jgi:transcriptional regulator GlxA family with amidase domain